jgi:hypothetical protein
MKRWMPLHYIFFSKKTLKNKMQKIVSGALTVYPIAICGLSFFLLALVSLGSGFLVSHPLCQDSLHPHALRG